MQQYIYGPIDPIREIRLLELFAGQHGETLEGEIIPQLLDHARPFCTLSYVWGSDDVPCRLETPDGYIPLTTSLSQALVAIRDPQRRILIWADAICIDQDDLAEKGVQISIMRDIYAQSSETIIHLGESSPIIDLALQAIQFVYDRDVTDAVERVPKIKRRRLPPSGDVSEDLLWVVTSQEVILRPDVESGIKTLCGKEWFRRRWVVQEVIVSREEDPVYLHVGNQCIEWDVLLEGLLMILHSCEPHSLHRVDDEYDEVAPDPRQRKTEFILCSQVILSIHQLQQDYRDGKMDNLCSLLKRFQATNCKREHDLILSLVGISTMRESLQLDWRTVYSSDVDVLCMSVALELVRTEGLENLFQIARYSSKAPGRLSWIPNIDQQFVPTTVFNNRLTCDVYRNAKGLRTTSIPWKGDETVLPLTVYVFDVVQTTLYYTINLPEELVMYEQISGLIKAMMDLFENAIDIDTSPPEQKQNRIFDLCAIVMVAGWCWSNIWSPSGEEALQEITSGFAHFVSLCMALYLRDQGDEASRTRLAEISATNNEELLSGLEFMANLSRVENMGMGTIGLTQRRFACNLPKPTLEGDLLAIVPGVGVPVVLQRHESNSDTYRYLGPAYVAGLMDGLALDLKGIEKREILLR